MNRVAQDSSGARYLDKFARLTDVIIKHVQKEYLLPYDLPDWSWPEDQTLPFRRVGQWMHRLYAPHSLLVNLLPSRSWLMLGVVFSIGLELTYPGVLTELSALSQLVSRTSISTIQFTWRLVGAALVLSVLILLELLLPLASAVGVYWSYLELALNRHISWLLKASILVLVLALVGLWLARGGVLLSDKMEYDEPDVQTGADRIRESVAYRLMSSIVFYVPSISYGALLATKAFLLAACFARSALYWSMSFHAPRRANVAGEFLRTPLPFDENEPATVLELDVKQIEALHDWAVCRRQVVYDRLLPTTILLAFLGALANTSLGEGAVKEALTVLREYSQMGDPVSWYLSYLRFAVLVAIIVLPAIVIFVLLNEGFAMDFIAQATVLARHAKLANEETHAESETSISKPRPGLCRVFDVLKKITVGSGRNE